MPTDDQLLDRIGEQLSAAELSTQKWNNPDSTDDAFNRMVDATIKDMESKQNLRKWVGYSLIAFSAIWMMYVAIFLPFMPDLKFEDIVQVALISTVPASPLLATLAKWLYPADDSA